MDIAGLAALLVDHTNTIVGLNHLVLDFMAGLVEQSEFLLFIQVSFFSWVGNQKNWQTLHDNFTGNISPEHKL